MNRSCRYLSTTVAAFLLLTCAGWAQIPSDYFGMHVNHGPSQFPLQTSYGSFRLWDTQAQWPIMSTCSVSSATCQSDPTQSTLNFTNLDNLLLKAKSDGISDGVLYTLSRTPSWASSDPTDSTCQYGNGQCRAPVGLNLNGSGDNELWDYWVTKIAEHANDATYLTTHAHINIWEPQNEFYANNLLYGYATSGTKMGWAQLLRITEDTRCIIKGVGTIHNYPTAGSSTSCSSYLAALPSWSPHAAIDSSALISTPSGTPDPQFPGQDRALQNFLYCNHSPNNDLPNGPAGGNTSTSCTWSSGANWGSAAVDVINFHFYEGGLSGAGYIPETIGGWVTTIKGYLTSTDNAKPLFNGEGSAIESGNNTFASSDPYGEAGAVARDLMLYWSYGITRNYWYAYDIFSTLWNGSALTRPGIAWNTVYGWLNGATHVNVPFCSSSGTIYTCPFTEPSGVAAEMVWDYKYGPGGSTSPTICSSSATPTICGNTSYTVPATYNGPWTDINGLAHAHIATVVIGAVPILLESNGTPVPPNPPTSLTATPH